MNLNSFIPSAGMMQGFMMVIIWGVIFIALTVPVAIIIRNYVKYRYSAEVFKRRQDSFDDNSIPQSQILKGKAGYFKRRKTGKTVFRIKYGLMPWQQLELTKLPNPKYMVGNKVYYFQLNKDNLVQAKVDIDWEGSFKMGPIEDDLEYGAYLDYLEKTNVLPTGNVNMPLIVGMGVLSVIIVVFIIGFYFLSKAG
jgi:hypothetical protein